MAVSLEELKSALLDDELELFYQPKVCLLRGKVVGSEALIRWCRKDGTVVGPDNFIPVAEETGLLRDITVKMLEQALLAVDRTREFEAELTLSMNVTPHDLESHQISQQIKHYIDLGRLLKNDLQIEITESVVMSDFDRVYDDLVVLNDLGIKVLMDDFGTGYSSIDRLSQLPFSALKLDKGVVSRMSTSKQNLNVVRSSISMARELRMTSVAEGVESEGAYNFLLASGCEEAQGYWISRPLKLDDYLDFLRGRPSFHGSQIGSVHQAVFNLIHFRKILIDAAYCKSVSSDQVLASVTDPEIRSDVVESRFGLWYYGVGSVLKGVPMFDSLEEPYISMHEKGKRFIQHLQTGGDSRTLDQLLLAIDEDHANLLSLLQGLERHLLSAKL